MLPLTRSAQRFLPSRKERVAPRRASDALDEFAPERAARGGHGPSRPWRVATLVAIAVTAAAAGASFVAIRDAPASAGPFIAPGPSPIEVEYPEYPGAPLLKTATVAMPARLTADTSAVPVTQTAAKRSAAVSQPSPRASLKEPRRAPARATVEPEARKPFDVRGAVPQVVAAAASDVRPLGVSSRSIPADAPPRRIGPPLTLTALGGTMPRNGRLALVLDVTEQGDVARVVAHEAVDVHPDVIQSISTAALNWRYEPARQDGVAVPARVRVVVQLNGN